MALVNECGIQLTPCHKNEKLWNLGVKIQFDFYSNNMAYFRKNVTYLSLFGLHNFYNLLYYTLSLFPMANSSDWSGPKHGPVLSLH